jgi:phosphohistidine phosphatase SixA
MHSVVWLGLLPIFFTQASFASDRTQCHDLPAKQSVLDEGAKLLDSVTPLKDPYKRDNWRNSSSYFDFFDEPEAHIQTTLSLESEDQLRKASETAFQLELFFRFDDANVLYTRILNNKDFGNLSSDERAEIYESTARTKIQMMHEDRLGTKTSPFRNNPRSVQIFEILNTYHSHSKLRDLSLLALSQAKMSLDDLDTAKKLYKDALTLRSAETPTDDVITDLIMLGAISEKKNELSDSITYITKAKQLIELKLKSSSDELTNGSHKPLVLNKLMTFQDSKQCSQSVLTSALIRLELKNRQAEKAIALFQVNCLEDDENIIISPESLLSLSVVYPAESRKDLVDYFIHMINTSDISDEDVSNVLKIFLSRGWSTECSAICLHIINTSYPKRLFTLAQWYADSSNDTQLLLTSKQILTAVRTESDEDAVTHLKRLKTLLSKLAKESPDNEIVAKCEHALNSREDAIRRKTCLEMASKLNATAFALETKAKPEMATKLYKEALDIKQKNLSANDPETASQFVDLARSEAAQQHYKVAEEHYERALAILRRTKNSDASSLISALESYGMMLNDWHHEAKAGVIYEEAKTVYKNSKSAKH